MPHLLRQLSPKYKIPAMPWPYQLQYKNTCIWAMMMIIWRIRGKLNCTVLCCVWQLCTVIRTHSWAVVTVNCLLRFRLGLHFVCFSVLINVIVFFYAFVVLVFLWLPYGIGQTIIFLPCGFFFFFFSFFPHLISAVADWMSAILSHMLWPLCEFKMQVWNVLHSAHWK